MEILSSDYPATLPPEELTQAPGAPDPDGSGDNTLGPRRGGRTPGPGARSPPAPGGGRWGAPRSGAPASLRTRDHQVYLPLCQKS